MQTLANLSDYDRGRMAQIGPVWGKDIQKNRDVVLDIYTPMLARSPKDGVRLTRNVPYGSHPRQVLDIFSPDASVAPMPGMAPGQARPVAVFVHGGAFVRGDKHVNDEIYDNVLWWLARHGVLGINIEYRLANEAPFPGGAEDLHAAVQWLVAHAAEYGGDAQRIYPIGHSAGGAHVASWAFDPNIAAKPGAQTRGLVIISGRVRADTLPENPNAPGVRAYFGNDAALYEQRSPVIYADRCALPVLIAIAEFENPLLDVYAAELLYRLSLARRRSPRFVRMAGHNHTSIVAHFNTGEEILGREILDFIAAHP